MNEPRRRQGWTHNATLGAALALTAIAMSALTRGRFWSAVNLQAMGFQLPELGLFSLAMMLPMLAGGINLAIVASANLTGILMALALTALAPAPEQGGSALGAAAAAILVGAGASLAIGLAIGAVINQFNVSPILATLGMMTLLRGFGLVLTRGAAIGGLRAIEPIGNGILAGVPIPLLLFGCAAGLVATLLNRRPLGLAIAMFGSSPTVTAFSGVDTRRLILKVYVASSLLAGLAALIMLARFNSAKVDYGESYLLLSILAAVLGGTSATGGFGRVSGLLLALLLLQAISSGFNLLGVNPFVTLAVWGAVILAVTGIRNRRRGLGPE